MQDLADAIALNTFLSQLPAATLGKLLEGTMRQTGAAGEVVYRQGDPPAVAFVVSGLLRAYVLAADGREATIWYGRAGDLLALETLFTPPRHLQLQVVTDAVAIVWPLEWLRERAQADPELLWGLSAEMARRLNQMFEELANNIFGTVRQRVARHLLELASHDDSAGALVVTSSAQALARAVGSAREVVSRTLNDLSGAGLIRIQRGSVTLLDASRLYDESCAHETHRT